jgi:hypothetical protein
MSSLERVSDYRGFGLERLHCMLSELGLVLFLDMCGKLKLKSLKPLLVIYAAHLYPV